MDKNSWIIKVKTEVVDLAGITETEKKGWEKHSIYKLPAYVTDLNEKEYKPQAVSFGPYHYDELKLRPMEVHKERALRHFLKRSGKPLEVYVDALGGILQNLKDAYDALEGTWLNDDSDAFLKLMLRDGCFMIEILRASSTHNQTDEAAYADNDPIFSPHGSYYALPLIQREMLMLENQLPMLLLKALLAVDNQDKIDIETGEVTSSSIQTEVETTINTLIHKLYFPNKELTEELSNELEKSLHVLDAYRRILLWTQTTTPVQDLPPYIPGHDDVLAARELEEAGIHIKNSPDTSLKAIDFNPQTGILSLPRIVVDDDSRTMFLNLAAFERFHVGAGNEVTDYIWFMDDIIDNATDVHTLERRGIIQDDIGSDRAIAELFNSLTEGLPQDLGSRLTRVRVAINHYCQTKWHKWRADLRETYFRNPWVLISIIAAIVLFGLTIVQTVFSGLQYQQGANHSPPPPPPRSRRS